MQTGKEEFLQGKPECDAQYCHPKLNSLILHHALHGQAPLHDCPHVWKQTRDRSSAGFGGLLLGQGWYVGVGRQHQDTRKLCKYCHGTFSEVWVWTHTPVLIYVHQQRATWVALHEGGDVLLEQLLRSLEILQCWLPVLQIFCGFTVQVQETSKEAKTLPKGLCFEAIPHVRRPQGFTQLGALPTCSPQLILAYRIMVVSAIVGKGHVQVMTEIH